MWKHACVCVCVRASVRACLCVREDGVFINKCVSVSRWYLYLVHCLQVNFDNVKVPVENRLAGRYVYLATRAPTIHTLKHAISTSYSSPWAAAVKLATKAPTLRIVKHAISTSYSSPWATAVN